MVLDELRRVAMFTSGVAELTRYRAEQIVKDLVSAGDVRREQASGIVRELLETSKASRQELVRFVRSEIQSQIAALGVADRRELERLERRVARLESAAPSSPSSSSGAPKGARKKTASKKNAGQGHGRCPISAGADTPQDPCGSYNAVRGLPAG